VLGELTTPDVQDFTLEFARKLVTLNNWDLWAAGYVITDGMGDDSFHYFRSWIIGKGRECFDTAIQNPAGLLPFLDNMEVDNEGLEYVALEILEGRGITEDPRNELDGHADQEPSGDPFDEDTVAERFPTLVRTATLAPPRTPTNERSSKVGFLQALWTRLFPG
jgi:hypothetical protein